MSNIQNSPLPRSTLYTIIWTVIFGVALAFGGSALDIFKIPILAMSFASPFVALMITLNKLIVFRRYSVTGMYIIASIIAIFTGYLGPPSILKPLFIIAGLSFDVATLFRTTKLNFLNLIIGHLAITITGFGLFWFTFALMIPGSSDAIKDLLIVAAPAHYITSILVAYFVFKAIPPLNPPKYIKEIRAQITGKIE